ncbi:MAG: LysM peptidoglycan-binding domain-containing protein [Planctomycetes bacterium]|jgi:nucleoid-associated protein YgaU|nr:LysM peptidoglycan-binding domain-containing protein [Planctomycetota bacterium]
MSFPRLVLAAVLLSVAACAGAKGSAIPEDEYYLETLPGEAMAEQVVVEPVSTGAPPPPPAYYEPPPSAPAPPAPPPPAREANASYKVRKGDTLYAIARAHLGSGSRWKEIASLNGLSKPYMIKVGQELRLP